MKYANTDIKNGVEIVITTLPLQIVPGFDPENPPQENTYSVDDAVQVGWIKVDGVFVPPDIAIRPLTLADFQRAHDAHLSAPALALGFRDFDTFALRAGYAGPYQAAATVYAQWLDACNIFGKQLMADVLSGTVPAPASTSEYIALLPTLTLPAVPEA